jgi:S-formylglutathione hydrolase FrmB
MKALLFFFLNTLSILCFSQHFYTGRIRKDMVVTDLSDVKYIYYTVYAPSDYDYSPARKYPVVYFLSGSFDQNDWINHGEVNKLFDKMIDERKMPPFIGIMLCGAAYSSADWKGLLKNYIFKYVESRERIDTTRRSIVGFSLGGYYSLRSICELGGNFKSAVSICPIESNSKSLLDDLIKAQNVKKERFDKFHDFLEKANKPLVEMKTDKPIMLLTADRDFALAGFNSIQSAFIKNPAAQIRILDGTHSWEFAVLNLETGLAFIGRQFFYGPSEN